MKMSFTSAIAQGRLAKITRLLQDREMTLAEICAAIAITPRWGREYIWYLRDRGEVYISSWVRTPEGQKDHPIAVFRFGNRNDARRPKKKSGVQRQREARAKMVADEAAHDVHKAKRRAKRLRPYRDWSSAWIPNREQA